MKNKILIVALFFLTLSCNKNYLDKQPIETATLESLFKTADDLVLAVNGIYNAFQGSTWGGSFYYLPPHMDAISEDAIFCCPWEGGFQGWAQGNITPSSGGIVDYKWNYGYLAISRINAVLANIDRTDLVLSDEVRLKTKAEVRFLRALIYFDLTNHYGGVPLIVKPIVKREDAKVPRNSKEEVLITVMEDVDFAAGNLGVSPLNNQIGRPTKQSALGLKTRILLYQQKWPEAAAAANLVIAMESAGDVQLSSNYASLFNGTNKADKEILFDIQFKGGGVGEGSIFTTFYGPNNVATGAGYGSITYMEPMFDAFPMSDGLPISSSTLYNPNNPYANRDSRLYGSFYVPGISTHAGQPYTINNYGGQLPSIGIQTKKWVGEFEPNYSEDGNVNFIILRYGDVLLMYAEAQNEVVGPDLSVYSALNKIRNRAGLPNIQSGMTKDQMRNFIRNERKIELSQEGLRFFDLVRWGIAEQKINSNSRETRNWKNSTHKLLPIPQREIDANPKLTQNPNY